MTRGRWGAAWYGACLMLGTMASNCSAPRHTEPDRAQRSAALESAQFVPISNSPFACVRSHAGLAYDLARERSVTFGGHAPSSQAGQGLKDTWQWDGFQWNSPPAGYAQRSFVSGVFDQRRSRIVSYGGHYMNGIFTNETWEFDGLAWASRTPLPNPGRRSSYGLVYDSARQVSVLFGGYDGDWFGDVWEWNGSNWVERCTQAPCSTSPRPAARANAVFVYDEARRVAVLFGGYGPSGSLSDTWLWNGSQFTEVLTETAPEPRDSAAATYDPVSSRVLLFGGIRSDGIEQNDLWAWNGATWRQLAKTTAPSPRQGARLAWDVPRRRAVLVGGEYKGSPVDAWEFNITGNSCATDQDCHEGGCNSGVCETSVGMAGSGGEAGQPNSGGQAAGGQAAGGRASGGVAAGGTSNSENTSRGGAVSSNEGGQGGGGADPGSAGRSDLMGGSGGLDAGSGGSNSYAGGHAASAGAGGVNPAGSTFPSAGAGSHAAGSTSLEPSPLDSQRLGFYSCSTARAGGRRGFSITDWAILSGVAACLLRLRRRPRGNSSPGA